MKLDDWNIKPNITQLVCEHEGDPASPELVESVRYVTTPADGTCGIGGYTQNLIESFEDATPSKTTFNSDTATLSTFLFLALKVAREDEAVVHVQFEYGLYCDPICQRLNVPAFAAILFFPLLYILSVLRGKRIFTTVHTVYDTEDTDRPWYGTTYLKFLHILIALTSESVVLLSKESRVKFRSDIICGKVREFPHGVKIEDSATVSAPDAKATFGYEKDEIVIALPGYIEHRKGHRQFIRIAKQLPEYEFLIGGGARTEDMQSLETQLRNESGGNVQVTGILGEDEFKLLFQAADAVLLPYQNIDQSGIFNWCAAYETPVVATDLPYFERLETDWGNVTLIRQETGIKRKASIVDEVVTSPSRCAEIKCGLRAYQEANSFRAVAEAHKRLYMESRHE